MGFFAAYWGFPDRFTIGKNKNKKEIAEID